MNHLIIASLPLVFWFGFWAGKARSRIENRAKSKKRRASGNLCDLSAHRAILAEIREGQPKKAVELMEFSVDCLVSQLWHQFPEADGFTRDRILRSLGDLKVYRQRWPRRPEPEFIASEELSPNHIREVADEATGILASMQSEPHESRAS